MNNERQKSWISSLLLLSCIAAGILLWKTDPVIPQKVSTQSQLDSLITLAVEDMGVPGEQIRNRTVDVDSVFSRRVYTLRVAPAFSKTTFHYELKRELEPFGVETVATVQFPEKNMSIHLLVNNTVHRSVHLLTDPDITYIHKELFTPPDQIENEVD